MSKRIQSAGLALVLAFGISAAWAKLPPPPPLDEKGKAAAEEKKAKDAVNAAKAKEDQAAAEEKAVKNYQANMKQAGKPIPKPTPVAAAAPAKPGDPKAAPAKPGAAPAAVKAPEKPAAKKT